MSQENVEVMKAAFEASRVVLPRCRAALPQDLSDQSVTRLEVVADVQTRDAIAL